MTNAPSSSLSLLSLSPWSAHQRCCGCGCGFSKFYSFCKSRPWLFLCSLLCLLPDAATATGFVPSLSFFPPPQRCNGKKKEKLHHHDSFWFRCNAKDQENEQDSDFFSSPADAAFSSREMTELSRRMQTVSQAQEWLDAANQSPTEQRTTQLPVIVFDQLLPRQRLVGSTTDDTFGAFLGQVGLGGLFVMTSLNHKLRKVRRNATVCRILQVDAISMDDGRKPSAVDFALQGCHYCRIVDASPTRLGRWRLCYDVQHSEEPMLGWGLEHLVEPPVDIWTPLPPPNNVDAANPQEDTPLFEEWSTNTICSGIVDPDQTDSTVRAYGQNVILPLLEQWQQLASRRSTYEDNVEVRTSQRLGGTLQLDPGKVLARVQRELGPPSEDNPQALAFWGAALVNPMPVTLGVAPECRGILLEAPTSQRRLQILEWAVRRSIANLNGSAPL